MRIENIRPKILVQKEKKFRKRDNEHIVNQKKSFMEILCPACESRPYHKLFKKNGFNFVICKKCGTVYVNPRPSPEMLENYYTNSESIKYWNDNIFPVSEDARRSLIFIPRAQKIAELCRKYNIMTEILVDVGAGFGTFCEEMKKLDVFNKVIAIEPSHDLAETCRSKGLQVIENTIEKVKFENANVITNFELVEHLFWPKDFLIACNNALSAEGLLILTTPNIKGFDMLVLGKLSENISAPSHINYFNPSSLSLLLNNCGFETIEILTPGKLDVELVREKILNGKLDVSSRPFLKYILIDCPETVGEAFQCFLSEHKLSSHLWIVAKKK